MSLFDSFLMGPAIPLVVGALALILLSKWLRPRPQYFIALIALGLASLSWLLLRLTPTMATFSQEWSVLVLPAASLTWAINGWSWLTGLVGLLAITLNVLFHGEISDRNAARWNAAKLLIATAALFLVTADNLLTLATIWMLWELALLAQNLLSGGQAARLSGMFAVPFIWLAVNLAGFSGAQVSFAETRLPELARVCLLVAALYRVAFYPFHLRLIASPTKNPEARLLRFLLPMTIGFMLFGRILTAELSAALTELTWLIFGVAALFGSALAAWLEPDTKQSLILVAVNRVAWCVVAATLLPVFGAEAMAWPLLTLVLGIGGLILGRRLLDVNGTRWPLALALLALLGTPGTVGLPLRGASVALLTGENAFGFVVVVLWILADIVGIAAVLRHWPIQPLRANMETQKRETTLFWQPRLSTALIFVPLVVFGLLPSFLGALLGAQAESSVFFGLPAQLWSYGLLWWILQCVSVGLGVLLAASREVLLAQQQETQVLIRRVASLAWLGETAGWLGRGFVGASALAARVFDGKGYVGWMILTGLIIVFFLGLS